MGRLGHFGLCFSGLYSMAFKIFKKISKLSFFIQIVYLALLFALLFLLKLNKLSFLAGLFFSYLYMGLFFYSIKLIFTKKNKALGVFLMFFKWLLLLLALFLVAWYLEAKSFLLGLSAILVLIFSYVLQSFKQI